MVVIDLNGSKMTDYDGIPMEPTASGTNACKQSLEPSAPRSKTVAGKPPTDLLEPTAELRNEVN